MLSRHVQVHAIYRSCFDLMRFHSFNQTGQHECVVGDDPDIVLQLQDVWLRIPVRTTETRTLKSALVRSVTGGALKRSSGGAMIEALRGINCTIRHGERVALIGHNGAGKSTF